MPTLLRDIACVSLLLADVILATACGASPSHPRGDTMPAKGAAPAASSPGARVERRVVIGLSRPCGTLVTTTEPDGTVKMAFDVLQNGRGPHVDATLRLASDGTIAALTA